MKSNTDKASFESLLNSFNKVDNTYDIEFETKMIMYRFLSEVEDLCDDNNLNRKMLAQKLGTSASYITQLFRGNKIINLELIAKIQAIFNVTFEVKAVEKEIDSKYEDLCENSIPSPQSLLNEKLMLWSYPATQTNSDCNKNYRKAKRKILAA